MRRLAEEIQKLLSEYNRLVAEALWDVLVRFLPFLAQQQ